MTSWHRNRRGRGCTTPRCRSQNIANNTFSEGWLQKSKEFAGLRTAPATHHAKNTANTTFSCGMLQNDAKRRFWDHTMWGGGGGSEPRTGSIYNILEICSKTTQPYTKNPSFPFPVKLFKWNQSTFLQPEKQSSVISGTMIPHDEAAAFSEELSSRFCTFSTVSSRSSAKVCNLNTSFRIATNHPAPTGWIPTGKHCREPNLLP